MLTTLSCTSADLYRSHAQHATPQFTYLGRAGNVICSMDETTPPTANRNRTGPAPRLNPRQHLQISLHTLQTSTNHPHIPKPTTQPTSKHVSSRFRRSLCQCGHPARRQRQRQARGTPPSFLQNELTRYTNGLHAVLRSRQDR